jgi:hypothetical protein
MKRTRSRSGGWLRRSRGRSPSTSAATVSEEAADAPPPWHKAPVSIPSQILVLGCRGDEN